MNGIYLVALSLSLSIPLGSPASPITLDVNPVIAIPFHGLDRIGFAAPGLIGYSADLGFEYITTAQIAGEAREVDSLTHELRHVRQQTALGPLFWLGYLGTAGRAFEPYDPLRGFTAQSWDSVWLPDPDELPNYPLFRISFTPQTTSITLLPGYPQMLHK